MCLLCNSYDRDEVGCAFYVISVTVVRGGGGVVLGGV